MADVLDYTLELRELASLAAEPKALDEVLGRALEDLQSLIPYDLAAILELRDGELVVRASRGPLASDKVREHRIALRDFPTVRAAIEKRRPMAFLEHHHASDEGDPYDGVLDLPEGHSCMVVPLLAGDRPLGIITFDRSVCIPYEQQVVDLAGVYGQIVALALAFAEQAELLARYKQRLEERHRLLAQEVAGESPDTRFLEQSRSGLVQKLVRQAVMVARTDTPVLILGETGAGKEILAHALHDWSARKNGPFVRLNCAAIPENLVESELFGHVKGAFSGAHAMRSGRFLTANGGTLLLDEIGDMPLAAQSKLLRVLQEGTFEPVGSDKTIKVDVRVIAATNVELGQAVKEGRFREDLYYRLDVFPLHLPALRERREDIAPLSEFLLAGISRRTGRGPWRLTQEAQKVLSAQDWPGNVRQLLNALERATILEQSGDLDAFLFEGVVSRGTRSIPPASPDEPILTLDEAERLHIAKALHHTKGRIYGEGGAAQVLGLKPSTLQSRMKKLGLERLQE